MWWLLKTIVFVVLLIVLVLVAVANDTAIDLDLLLWKLQGVQLYLVLFGAALFGFLSGLALLAVRELKWRIDARRLQRNGVQLQREVDELRRAPLSGLDDPSSVGHGPSAPQRRSP